MHRFSFFAASALAAVALAGAPVCSAAQGDAPSARSAKVGEAGDGSNTKFADFPAPKFRGKPAPVRFAGNKDARMYRTRLREGAAEGPNFAGHYTVVTWGCGTSCVNVAIVDARTGAVVFPAGVDLITFPPDTSLDADSMNVYYKPYSSLFVVVGAPGESGAPGTYYYEWKNDRMRLVKLVKAEARPGAGYGAGSGAGSTP